MPLRRGHVHRGPRTRPILTTTAIAPNAARPAAGVTPSTSWATPIRWRSRARTKSPSTVHATTTAAPTKRTASVSRAGISARPAARRFGYTTRNTRSGVYPVADGDRHAAARGAGANAPDARLQGALGAGPPRRARTTSISSSTLTRASRTGTASAGFTRIDRAAPGRLRPRSG